jgi:pimeloyl-ACP methyl ester carboxylesterase
MATVTSSDGTTIAYDKIGSGPALILVDGALCYRAFGPMSDLAKLLAPHFTVYTYDRRGRGESGDTRPYSVQREVDDIEALVKEAGGSAYLYGISSGAALAVTAAASLSSVTKLATYEAPFIVDDTATPRSEDYTQEMEQLIAEGRNGDAVKKFMKTVGAPGIAMFMVQLSPAWKKLKSVAPTLPYDFHVLGDTGRGKPLPAEQWTTVTIPTLVMDGGKSPAWMRNSNRALADALPNSQHRTLPGQTHMVKADAVAPMLVEFFA